MSVDTQPVARIDPAALFPTRPRAPIELHVAVSKDADEDEYSIVALNLPGLASCGDSEEEAIGNIKEAAAGVIASYEDAGLAVPWKIAADPVPAADTKHFRIALDA